MRLSLAICAAAAAIGISPAFAQPVAGGMCQEAARVVDDGLKDLAMQEARTYPDDPMTRAGARADERQTTYSMIQSNLTVMAAARCAMPKLPISPDVYYEAASRCANAARTGTPAACDRSTWQPGPRWRGSGG